MTMTHSQFINYSVQLQYATKMSKQTFRNQITISSPADLSDQYKFQHIRYTGCQNCYLKPLNLCLFCVKATAFFMTVQNNNKKLFFCI